MLSRSLSLPLSLSLSPSFSRPSLSLPFSLQLAAQYQSILWRKWELLGLVNNSSTALMITAPNPSNPPFNFSQRPHGSTPPSDRPAVSLTSRSVTSMPNLAQKHTDMLPNFRLVSNEVLPIYCLLINNELLAKLSHPGPLFQEGREGV